MEAMARELVELELKKLVDQKRLVGQPTVELAPPPAPDAEAAQRLAGTYDPSGLKFVATVQVASPVEFVKFEFIVNDEEK